MCPEDAGGFGEFEAPLHPADHNKPPVTMRESGEILEQHLKTTHAKIFERAALLIAAEARLPAEITSEYEDEKATAYVKQIQACEKELDALRTGEKAPYDLAGSQVHSTFRIVQDKLTRPSRNAPPSLKERVEAKQTAYKVKVAAEKRAQLEAEAARLRAIEEETKKKREAEEAEAKAVEEERRRVARVAELKAQKEADDAAAAARAAEAAASRKRNADALAKANADAAEKRKLADEAEAKRKADAVKRQQEDEAAAADRRKREDAARAEADKAAEARAQAEKDASAKSATMTRARGAHGGISSLRTYWDFRDLDRANLNLELLRDHLPAAGLESAVRSFIKAGGRKCAGVSIYEREETATH